VWFLAYLFFYPTLWWNRALCRLHSKRRWWDWVDEHVLIGALPSASHVEKLKHEGIGAVINTCREYDGPVKHYADAGIEQLHLPTVDFTPPTMADVKRGVEFIQAHITAGRKVYVHCKAGRGRSATIVICYLIAKGMSPAHAQALLLEKRPQVNKVLTQRQVVKDFAALQTQKVSSDATL
jgi:atypical dual specificity phosphatase